MHVKDAPKGVIRVTPDRLSPGDVLFISTPSSWELVRSSLLRSDPPRYEVRNRMCPDPTGFTFRTVGKYGLASGCPGPLVLFLPKLLVAQDNVGLKPREQPEFEPDYRSYWNWDPKDERAVNEYYAVEEREWEEVKRRWREEVSGKAQPSPKAKRPGPKPRAKKPLPSVPTAHLAWYKILGVTPGVTPAALKKAYKRAAFRYHPDRCKRAGASEMFKKVSEAYAQLTKEVASRG